VLEGGLDGVELERGEPAPKRDNFSLAGPEPPTIQPVELRANPAVVVDLALSRAHHQGHIPGAWFAIRARLAAALDRLPAEGELVLTSEDGAIARFAAAELRTRRPVKVLSVSARDRPPSERERYMREYLAWEVELVNQIARDTDCRFRLAPA